MYNTALEDTALHRYIVEKMESRDARQDLVAQFADTITSRQGKSMSVKQARQSRISMTKVEVEMETEIEGE